MMADDNQLLNNNNGVGGDDVFVYTGGEQEVPRDVIRVRIAENVDTIPARTFQGCEELIEVEGHKKIKKIEEDAFGHCSSLRTLTKMAGVKEIEVCAFLWCHALIELEFDKLEIIGHGAFASCSSMSSINMPSIRRVGGSAFAHCTALTDVVFGQDLERIEEFAFDNCTALRSIAIPLKDNLIIGNHAFKRCENLSRVDILSGGIHETISSLHMESWRDEMEDEMEDEIDSINRTLPNTTEKTAAIQEWITRVLDRMVELHDDNLFKQPDSHLGECPLCCAKTREINLFRQPNESHLGECPICFLPLPLDEGKTLTNSCCCKRICNGCSYANQLREVEQGLTQKCPYCREPLPETEEEYDQNYLKRVKVNDQVAMSRMGLKRYRDGDYEGAFEYFTKAAALGDIIAHYNLSVMYQEAEGVEKDLKKKVYHLEKAAIGGHPAARYNLGNHEYRNGQNNRAMKHWIIAANLGDDGALDMVKQGFMIGLVSKEDYEGALRGHQAAVDATKSTQRDAAEEFYKQRESNH